MHITAKLLETRKNEFGRLTRRIVVNIPELGWEELQFRPSSLRELINMYQDNYELIKNKSDEAIILYKKFIRVAKSVADAFYTSRHAMGWDEFFQVMETIIPILERMDSKQYRIIRLSEEDLS